MKYLKDEYISNRRSWLYQQLLLGDAIPIFKRTVFGKVTFL